MNEHSNKAKPSITRRAAVIGACVGGMLGLIYRYGTSISRIRIEDLLPYLPFFILFILVYPFIFFVSSKVLFGQMIEIENLNKRTVFQSLVILVISYPIAMLVAFPLLGGDFALSAVIAACAAFGALGFWIVEDWINTWRQSGFKRVLFRTVGAVCAALVASVLSLGLAFALPRIPGGFVGSILFGGVILLPVFVGVGTVVDRILSKSEDQEPAQDVASDMSETGSIVPHGPATYDELKSLRGKYALILIGIVVVSCLLIGPGQLALQYSENVLLPAMVISIFSALLCAVVTGIYAQKIGIPRPIIPALIALLPFVPWIALFTVVGYTPIHLKESEPAEDSRFAMIGGIIGLLLGLLPVAVMTILGLVNPRYVAQLFLGPPIGANIPGLPIACGWPILGMILLGVLFPPVSLGLGFYRRLVRGRWKLLLIIIVLLQCAFPSVWLVLMGPAAVQVFKQFFGGRY